MSQCQIRFTIPVDIGHPAALGLDSASYQMPLPQHPRLLGVLEPPQSVGHPTGRDHVGCSIVIDVDRPLPAIRDEFASDFHSAVLMPLPLDRKSTRLTPVTPTSRMPSSP